MDGRVNASLIHKIHECGLSWLNLSNTWVQTMLLQCHGYGQEPRQSDSVFHLIYDIDYMRTRFVRALLVTICAFLAIKNNARIDAYRSRIDSDISQIVSPCSRTVRPKLADTKFHQSFVTMTLFSCVIMGKFSVFKKTIRKR